MNRHLHINQLIIEIDGEEINVAQEIIPFVEKAMKKRNPRKIRVALGNSFEELAASRWPDRNLSELREALSAEWNRATNKLITLKRQRDMEAPISVFKKALRLRDVNFVDQIFGWTALIALIVAICVIPLVSSEVITSSGKLGLLSDYPSLAFIIGTTGIGGMLGSAYYRHTIPTDEGRRRYDQRLIKWAMSATVLWASAFALSTYPITFGGNEAALSTGGWGEPVSPDAEGQFRLSIPPAITLIATVIMELCSGAVFHLIAAKKLAPKIITRTEKNPKVETIDSDLIPSAEVELAQAALRLEEHAVREVAQQKKRDQFVSQSMARFEGLLSATRAASDRAVAETIIAALVIPPHHQPKPPSSSIDPVTRH